jgi:hypothetical protein
MIDILDRIAELRELKSLYVAGDLREYDFDVRLKNLLAEVEKFESENAPEEGAQLVFNTELWSNPSQPGFIKQTISHKDSNDE